MKDQVILYGLGSKMLYNRNWYNEKFKIVGFSDTDPSKKHNVPFAEIPFISPKDLTNAIFDYIIVCSVKAEEISDYLVTQIGIPKYKIKTDHEVYIKDFFNNVNYYGELNADKTIVIIGRTGLTYGLFWYINYFSQYIREIIKNDYIPVIDMQNYYNIYLEDDEVNNYNSWEFFFEQPMNITLKEAYNSKKVIHIPDTNFISEGSYAIGNIYYNYNIRKCFCDISKTYIRLNENMKKKFEIEYSLLIKPLQENRKKIIGVLYRGTDFQNIKPYLHAVQPTLEQLIETVKRLLSEWHYDYVYLSTDDQTAVNTMKDVFEDQLICYDRERFSNTGKTRLAFISFERDKDRYIKGVDYLMEISLLSKCNSIVAGKAGGTIGALLFNQLKYEHEYFFELGLYGPES